MSVLCSVEISTKDDEMDQPSLYWIPKLHKCPYKLYCWVCQMLHETSLQIINIYSISGHNRASELRFVPSYGKVFVSTVAILFFMKQLP
jgi:hypothetical protein